MVNTAFWWAIGSVFFVSLISFTGALTLVLRKAFLDKILFYLVSFAAGTLLGAAFLDLLPEAVELNGSTPVFIWTLVGILTFLLVERVFLWYHCHDHKCTHHKVTPVGYLNIVGDGIHNFLDGVVIAASYLVSIPLGIVTTVAVMFHEIPQEIGDFGILIYSGFSRAKALFYNFLTALTAVLGALVALFYGVSEGATLTPLIAFAAGGFLYISLVDLLPELHHQQETERTVSFLASFFLGIATIWALTTLTGA
jgi:zinc and cadmium transporter